MSGPVLASVAFVTALTVEDENHDSGNTQHPLVFLLLAVLLRPQLGVTVVSAVDARVWPSTPRTVFCGAGQTRWGRGPQARRGMSVSLDVKQ